MPENKQFIVNIGDQGEIWDSDMFAEKGDALFAKYKDAEVFEVEDTDSFDEDPTNHQYIINLGDQSELWDADMVRAKGAKLMEAYPDVKIQRVSYKDYWGERATANRERRKALEQPDAERNARLAEIGYYDDLSYGQGEFNMDTDLGYGLKPLSSAIETNSVSGEATYLDPRVQEFFVNDTAETERQAEIARLDAEYESNPSVIRQREQEAQIAKEREEYIDKSLAEIKAEMGNLDALKVGKGAMYASNMPGVGDAAMGAQIADMFLGNDPAEAYSENKKLQTLASAAKLFEKAKQAREVAGKGFWAATGDVAENKVMDLFTQSDIIMYNEIGYILTRLEDKLGSLDDVGEDVLEANLSKEEQALIKAFFEYNSAMSDAQQDMSGAYKGGKIFGESVGFMLEFLATGGLAGGAGKAASSGVGRALVKWASKAAKGTAKRAFRTGTTKALRGLSSAAVGTLARTVAAPGTYRNMAEQSVKIEDGHLDRTKNAMKGFFDSYIENLSEISGGVIGKSLGMFGLNPSKLLGKVSFGKIGQLLADNRLAQGLSKGVKALFGKQGALAKLGFTGIFEEVEEEYIGNFIREVTGVQPGALAEMHKDGNFGAMLIGFAPMTLFGAGMSAANMAATNIEAANLGKKLRETLGQHYTEDAVSHMMSLVDNAENADDVWKAIEPMAGALNEEETTMLYQYGAFKAQNKAMLFARKAQERQLADAKRAEIQQEYGKFWQEGEDGAQSVQMADLNDGRRVFVLSAANEQGEMAVVDTRTGETGIANVADIKSAEQDGVTSPQTRTWSMDAFLDYTIALERRSAEQTRMVNERDQQIEALKSGITEGMEINLGTEGSPVIMLATGQFTRDGVLAGDASGNIHAIGWEQAADALGTPIRVKTDQDLIDEETAAIAARRAERRNKAGSASQQLRAALDETAQQTAEVVSLEERHIPKNPDGSVNETAFWEQDPEGYAQWNDEQNNDGGADTMRQLAVSKMLLAGVLAEAQKATQTSNPAERKAAEQAVREIQGKIDRYTAIEQSYVERAIAPLRERAMKWNSLTGASVILVENEEQLAEISGEAARQSAGGARVRGFAKDGRAYIYLPGVQDAAEIDAVFVHEAVSHQGLKGLLGQKGFDELCEQVWQMMSPEMQNVFINYPGVNGNRLAAADEYIAHIAERIGTGVADETERTIWEKIVDFVRNILRAMGIEVGMNERELSDLLHMAYADLAKNLSEAEKIAQQNAERKEAVGAAPTTARQMYDAYIKEGLTPEEVSQGVQNDFKAAKDAYDAKVTEKPTIKAGESTASFIERKKAYNEELGRLEQELRMQQALMDEIAKIQTPATEETAVEEAPVAEEVLEDNGIGVEAIGLDESAAEGEDVRFSTIREVNDRFNAELQQQIDGTLPVGHVYQLGMPSRILRSTGIPGLPITLQSSILNIKSNDALHSYDLSEVKDLVKAIQKPWAIFKYGDSQKAQNLIVGIAKGDKQFLIGISLNPTVKGKTLNINSVRNVFPKDNDEWLNWIQEGKLLRVDEKEKIQAIIDALRINPVDYTHLDLDSIANIVENFENPSSEDARFSVITPQMDADYLAAVERGDMETAQRMVIEAAKLAMPNTKVVDENGNPKVVWRASRYGKRTDYTVFDPEKTGGRGFYFANKEAAEKWYGGENLRAFFLDITNPDTSNDFNVLQAETKYSPDNDGVIFAPKGMDDISFEAKAFFSSQIKSAEPVTYDDNGDVIPLSERFNPENEDIRFSARTDEQREKLFADAKARFGLTNNFKVAGYMLPDGSLLDFSEANDGGDPDQRSLDHREIEGIIMDEGIEYDSRWMYLADFMNEGAIRLLPEYAGINLMKAPTKEQRQRLMDFIYKYNGEVILEIADERLNNVAYVEYGRRTSPSRIFRDIDGYFNEGIVPEQDTRFSIANENQAIFVSNAARAVEAIKMEKATPEQWLKMIEKSGGLKAGEDKWMGLSDWLKASKAKTLTKAEVLDFINENMIIIEETHYSEDAEADAENTHAMIERILQEKFGNYIAEYYEQNNGEDDNLYGGDSYEYAMDKLREEMNDEFPYTIERSSSVVYLTFPYEETDDLQEWADKLGVKFAPQNPINNTRLHYTTNGLRNNHEIVLTVPTIEPWNESDKVHFGDAGEGRAVAWIRFGETWEQRPSPQISRKVLVIDEIQSKRHQEGREKGYTTKEAVAQRKAARARAKKATNDLYDYIGELVAKYPGTEYSLERVRENSGRFTEEEKNKLTQLIMEHNYAELELEKHRGEGVPDAPFDKNWHELAMKRMLRYAAEEGYNVIAWTKGEQQAERYNLSHLVKRISVSKPTEDGSRIVDIHYRDEYDDFKNLVVDADGKIVHGEYAGNTLADVVGKEMALQIMKSEEATEFKGEGLKVGGEGMKGFYDKMLPAFMNKYGKKWGVKVEDITLPNVEEAGRVMHSVSLTEEMKASVREGQVMFSVRNTPISPEVRAEMDVIAATAMVNGNYMLAPNGQPTKLTADQWAMVRTKNFINWFGDWINDPESASKVVDPETREPRVMYHGSAWHPLTEPKGNAVFRMRSGLLGRGAYFASSIEEATLYAEMATDIDVAIEGNYEILQDEYVTDYFLNIRNTEDIRDFGRGDIIAVAKSPSQIKSATDNTGEFSESEDIRFSAHRPVGGNRGYVGYSMSKRAAAAREEGRYPKTDFRKEYGVTEKALDALVKAGIINNSEWHHTSVYGNKTTFYGWDEDYYADIYAELKSQIDKLAREGKTEEISKMFSEHPISVLEERKRDRVRKIAHAGYVRDKAVRDADSKYKAAAQKEQMSKIKDALAADERVSGNWFNASNGVGIRMDTGNINYPEGLSRADKNTMREEARKELADRRAEVIANTPLEYDEAAYNAAIESAEQVYRQDMQRIAEEYADLAEEDTRFSAVTDPMLVAQFESEPKVKVYRAMQLIDGKLYPPMSAYVDGVLREPSELGQWEQEEENTIGRNKKDPSKVDLEQGKGDDGKKRKTSGVLYNPYFHTSLTPLNDQFSGAQTRSNLVIVETEVPQSELTSGYQAEGAANSVGMVDWHSGPIAGVLAQYEGKGRQVILSRWAKPIRIVPESEIADIAMKLFEGTTLMDVPLPSNVFTPALREELERRGMNFVETTNNGRLVSDRRRTWSKTYGKNGLAKRPTKDIRFSIAERPVDEIVNDGKMMVARGAEAAKTALLDRMKNIDKSLEMAARMIASAQREYDRATVKIITDAAQSLLKEGALSKATNYEVSRLLSAVKNATGRKDLTKAVNTLIDIMVANQLRHSREMFRQMLKIKATRVNASGVEAQGRLDLVGQKVVAMVKEAIEMDLSQLEERIGETEDRISSGSETVRSNAEIDLVGLKIAKQYLEGVKASESEEILLRDELKRAGEDHAAGSMTDEAYREFVKSTEDAVRQNRIERTKEYRNILHMMAQTIADSFTGAKNFRDAEKARIERIHHFANSDLQGMSAEAHEQKVNEFWNAPLVRLVTAPLATFEQWMRVFGQKSAEGKGYLYNHFVGGWNDATNAEYLGIKSAHEILDAKVQEVFAGVAKRWSDLFSIDKKMPTATISMWDDGQMRDYEVTQGNLLYVYMVNKMTDGKMKLRKMGITEADVDAIVRQMDPRFLGLADWIQDEFLPGLRDKYNEVHERLFGAPMAAIDSYFPIRVLANARVRDIELGADTEGSRPSSITGSIIKRTKNSLALDVLGSNAFDVVLEHIEQMEHWAAFAEFNRDLNTLLSYRTFRNRVQNMSTAFGSGREAWNSFKETAEIVAGVYKPKTSKVDKALTNAVKGLTAGKISLRLWTAMKQVLSMPAFLPYVNPAHFVKNFATPWIAWNWAMDELPAFEKRWRSREAGNVRLKKTDADWKLWSSKIMEIATRIGMTPNAAVDAFTCAIGAKSVYDTMYARYTKDGYSHEMADKKAKLDATVAFNATQQSSESAFVSAIQSDRTFVAHMATVFRNNSFGMGREFVDALRNMRDRTLPGYKEMSIEFMRKQMVREGVSEEDAVKAAERIYRNALFKDAARIATFGFMMQFLWNLGNNALYLMFGDDDDEKKEMVKDALIKGAFGSAEGLAFGTVVPELASAVASDKLKNFSISTTPAVSDVKSLWKELNTDFVAGASDLVNIIGQMAIGINPQTIVDVALAIYDACEGNLDTSKEVAIALLRIVNAPQSNIDRLIMDEVDFTIDEGLDMTIDEFARRYARYKKSRNAPYTEWAYSDEAARKAEEKYIKRFRKDAEALKRTRGNENAQEFYEYYDNGYKETSETLRDLRKRLQEEDSQENRDAMEQFQLGYPFFELNVLSSDIRAFESARKAMKDADTPEDRSLYESLMYEARDRMVKTQRMLEFLEPYQRRVFYMQEVQNDLRGRMKEDPENEELQKTFDANEERLQRAKEDLEMKRTEWQSREDAGSSE